MNIGIDIDDTVLNLQEYKFAYATKYAIDKFNYLNMINPYTRYVKDILNWDDNTELTFFTEYFHRKMLDITPKPLSKEIINKLKEEGNKIYFITARCDEIMVDALEISKKWLDSNGFNYDGLYVNTKYKLEKCKELNMDIFIDDEINNCVELNNAGIKSFLFDSPTNRNVEINNEYITKVYNWPQIYYLINNLNK